MTNSIAPATTMGLVALSVANLRRSLDYYEQGIGLALLEHSENTATLGVGTRALLHLREQPGARLVQRATGLYHFALLMPSRVELARVIQHLAQTRTPIGGASDHLVSEALYLSDPDGHGIEIYRDRPRSDWYDARGQFRMDTIPLDIPAIMRELPSDVPVWNGMHADTVMGHVHLQVADVPAAEAFYLDVLGFERMTTYPGASFISAGGYHHHLGLNTWASRGAPPPPDDAARLLWYDICLPDAAALNTTLDRVRAAGIALAEADDAWTMRDPSQNTVRLRAVA